MQFALRHTVAERHVPCLPCQGHPGLLKAESRQLQRLAGARRLLQVTVGMSLKLLLLQPHHPLGIVKLLSRCAASPAAQCFHRDILALFSGHSHLLLRLHRTRSQSGPPGAGLEHLAPAQWQIC